MGYSEVLWFDVEVVEAVGMEEADGIAKLDDKARNGILAAKLLAFDLVEALASVGHENDVPAIWEGERRRNKPDYVTTHLRVTGRCQKPLKCLEM